MRSIIVAALLVSIASMGHAAADNPFTRAKVGDWVEYKMTGSNNIAGTTKMTVVAKDDKELTYEVAATFSFLGNETTAPVQKMKIDLTKSYDPIVAANLKQNNVKIEKEGEGTEKIKAGGKEYDTKWTKCKATATANNMTITTDYKMWFSKDVPLSGLVRMETTMSTMTTTLELVATGSK